MPDGPPYTAEGIADIRARAGHAVRVVAGRLADDSITTSRHPLSLADGAPGVALLFAELGHHDTAYREVADAHLEAATDRLVASLGDGLFDGLAAVAFTARAASRSPLDYAMLLDSLDQHIIARTNALVFAEHKRTTARKPGVDSTTYDVTHGLTGLGAYLLTAHRHSLADVLTALVELTETVTVPAGPLPGWWVPHPGGGYVDLGLAHGIAGPLALLALTWRADVRVTGQEQAMHRIAEWLIARARYDSAGGYWPATLTTAEELAGGRGSRDDGRTGWCHGTPGVARALQLAGTALDVPKWNDLAVAALTAQLSAGDVAGAPVDASLCHGWAGVLHVTRRVARDSGDERLHDHAHRLAERVLAGFDTAKPFCFDQAGFLDGAAGIALALHAYAQDAAPASGWDRALLLA